MVRLKAPLGSTPSVEFCDFNSSMVRLKEGGGYWVRNRDQTFQFLYGAIKRNQPANQEGKRKKISIPLWCD